MNVKHLLFLLGITILFFSNCKKKYEKQYPEDTEKTYDTPVERLCSKWWYLDSVSLNGIDYTDTVLNQCGEYRFYIKIEEVKDGTAIYRNGGIYTQSPYGNLGILFFFVNDDNRAIFYPDNNIFKKDTIIACVPHFFRPFSSQWDIRKLSNSIMKIQYQYKDSALLINYFKTQ